MNELPVFHSVRLAIGGIKPVSQIGRARIIEAKLIGREADQILGLADVSGRTIDSVPVGVVRSYVASYDAKTVGAV